MKRLVIVAALAAATLFPVSASATTVPNLVALATPDGQVALTIAARPTRATLADAGAFASTMTEQFGMVGIPNYDPQTNPDTILVCDWAFSTTELLAVYSTGGVGTDEAAGVCQYFTDIGYEIRWD